MIKHILLLKVEFLFYGSVKIKGGGVAVTVIYNKKNPSEYYIKELKELEVSENSKIGITIIGGLFILAGLCTIYVGIFK